MVAEQEIEKKQKKLKEKVSGPKDESSVTFYLHASFFLFFLMSYTFLLFLYENKYPLVLNNEILPEVIFACGGLLVFSFGSLLALSFSKFLARLFIAIIAGAAVAYIVGLLYPVNIGNYWVRYLFLLPPEKTQWAAEHGNFIIGCIVAFCFLIMLHMFKGGSMAFLSLPVLVALFLLLNASSKQTFPEIFEKSSLPLTEEEEKETDNLIYLILADHTGYNAAVDNFQLINQKAVTPNQKTGNPSFINAFYQNNNFTFYPTAYVRYSDKYRNIGSFLNPSLTEFDSEMFNRDDAAYYISSEDARVYTTRNDLFKALNDKGYKLNVYQTYPFDFCKGAGDKAVKKCHTYPAPLGALYQTNMTTASRLMLLIGHWLHSSPLGRDSIDYLQNKFKTTSVPFLGNPLSQSLPIGQAEVLTRLRQDVINSKGKNVFFAHLDLPHYPYVYDKYCRLRSDPMTWRSYAPYKNVSELNGGELRWDAYTQQLACTYGQLNYLVQDLKKAGVLDNTKIVIHGDKGSGVQKEPLGTRVEEMVDRFKRTMSTTFAVYEPKQKSPEVNQATCDVSSLVSLHVLGIQTETCRQPDFTPYTNEEQKKALEWLALPVAPEFLKKEKFDTFYTDWLEKGGQAFMASAEERQKLSGVSSADAGKMNFVAPPLLEQTPALGIKKAKNAKKTSFVPVPEEKFVTEDSSSEEISDIEPEQDTGLVSVKEITLEEGKPKVTEVVIAEDLAELPKPIVLPEIDPEFAVKRGWQTVDEPEKFEPLPVGEDVLDLPSLPEFSEVPVPVAVPVNGVVVKDLAPIDMPLFIEDIPPPSVDLMPAMDIPAPTELPASVSDIEESSVSSSVVDSDVQVKATVTAEATAVAEVAATATAQAAATAVAETIEAAEQIAAEEAKRLAEAEAQIKAEERALRLAESEAQAQAEIEALEKAIEEAKAKAEEQARNMRAEIEAQARAEEEARIKAEVQAKIRAEEEAKIRADEEAKLRAEAEAKAKLEAAKAEVLAKEQAEIDARAKEQAQRLAVEEARLKEQEKKALEEEAQKKAPPPPPKNADQLDITREVVSERINADGETETYIFIERKPNPNRFKKKNQVAKERELQQEGLVRTERSPAQITAPELTKIPAEPEKTTDSAAPVAVISEPTQAAVKIEEVPAASVAKPSVSEPVTTPPSSVSVAPAQASVRASAPIERTLDSELIQPEVVRAPARQVVAPAPAVRAPAPAQAWPGIEPAPMEMQKAVPRYERVLGDSSPGLERVLED